MAVTCYFTLCSSCVCWFGALCIVFDSFTFAQFIIHSFYFYPNIFHVIRSLQMTLQFSIIRSDQENMCVCVSVFVCRKKSGIDLLGLKDSECWMKIAKKKNLFQNSTP